MGRSKSPHTGEAKKKTKHHKESPKGKTKADKKKKVPSGTKQKKKEKRSSLTGGEKKSTYGPIGFDMRNKQRTPPPNNNATTYQRNESSFSKKTKQRSVPPPDARSTLSKKDKGESSRKAKKPKRAPPEKESKKKVEKVKQKQKKPVAAVSHAHDSRDAKHRISNSKRHVPTRNQVTTFTSTSSTNNRNHHNGDHHNQGHHNQGHHNQGHHNQGHHNQGHRFGRNLKFRLSLPSEDTVWNKHQVPWFQMGETHYDENDTKNGASKTKSQHEKDYGDYPTPTGGISEAMLQSFDEELIDFGAYVKLRNNELESRNYLVEHIQSVAQDVFYKSIRDGGRIEVIPFGSYAAQEVCTFYSDVDLAVWGAVPLPHGTHINFSNHDDDAKQSSSDDDLQHKPARLPQHSLNHIMQSLEKSTGQLDDKIQKWRDALNVPSSDSTPIASVSTVQEEKKETEDKSLPAEVNDVSSDFLFVIDRKPGAVEGVTSDMEKEHTIENKSEQDGELHRDGDNNICNVDAKSVETEVIDVDGGDNVTSTTSMKKGDKGISPEDHLSECSDDDSADQMESFGQSAKISSKNMDHSKSSGSDSTDGQEERYIVDLVSSDDSDTDEEDEFAHLYSPQASDSLKDSSHGGFQVSFVSTPKVATPNQSVPKPTIGPTGKTRKLVVDALSSLGRKLWKSSVTQNVEVRRHARVPIITMTTRLGFDGDIALGGHNGTDTSQYASIQIQKYQSFAPVVLLLKILLQQTDLDKPFTGGLGSYKLYVLVAHHLERHLALGGSDRPAEVLIAFLVRFGSGSNGNYWHPAVITELSQHTIVHGNGGMAELQAVFKLVHCERLFRMCLDRLTERCKSNRGEQSFLGTIIDINMLIQERRACISKSALMNRFKSADQPINSWFARDHPGKVTPGRKIGHVFSKTTAESSKRQKNEEGTSAPVTEVTEADKIMAGYGYKRGPRGALIPRQRPDLEAKRAATPESNLLGRATKNRKNKKKQTRDQALHEFASNNI